jgi:uncharacterized protein YcfL
MKFRSLVVASMLLVGCVSQQPPVMQSPPVVEPSIIQQPPVVQQPPVNQPSGLSDTPKSQIKNRDRDLVECERESAFAGAGDKRRVFDNCMKTRGY